MSLMSQCFPTFSMALPKTDLFINLIKSFSKSFFAFFLNYAFISTYVFNQVFSLNLMTFIFLKTRL